MSIATVAPPHPVLRCTVEVGAALDAVAGVEPLFMSTADKATALVELSRLEARLAELKGRVLAVADDVAAEHGARDAAAWLAHATPTEPTAARSDLHLARALQARPWVAAGMRAGLVSKDQARVIIAAIEDHPHRSTAARAG